MLYFNVTSTNLTRTISFKYLKYPKRKKKTIQNFVRIREKKIELHVYSSMWHVGRCGVHTEKVKLIEYKKNRKQKIAFYNLHVVRFLCGYILPTAIDQLNK